MEVTDDIAFKNSAPSPFWNSITCPKTTAAATSNAYDWYSLTKDGEAKSKIECYPKYLK